MCQWGWEVCKAMGPNLESESISSEQKPFFYKQQTCQAHSCRAKPTFVFFEDNFTQGTSMSF